MTATPATAEALHAVASRVRAGRHELARRIVDRYREEIVGYQDADEPALAGARAFVVRNIEWLVDGLERDEPVPAELLETAREVGARRVHQGLSLDTLLHQGRVWGEMLWQAVLEAARIDRPEEREAALAIAGRLWRLVDVVSTALAHAYLDEVTDRGLVSRDLLDALLAGAGDDEQVRRLARMVHRRLGEDHVVVVIRSDETPPDDGHELPRGGQVALDRIVAATRAHLSPPAAPLLVGIRQGDVVALYPAAQPKEVDAARRECAALAASLTLEVSVGLSGWHRGRRAIATAYAEAREAVEIAAGTGIRGRAVVLDDVVVDHMLRASAHARRILHDTLQPLVDYDRGHRSELVATLRAYFASGASLTRSAALLGVHPNTVVYRLRRIREISGRDAHAMEDLQILFLALKLDELSADPPSSV